MIDFSHTPGRIYISGAAIVLIGIALLWWLLLSRKKSQSFAKLLPRVYELRAMSPNPSHADAYFQDFEQALQTHHSALSQFQDLESDLATLDSKAWDDLKSRAAKHLISQTRAKGRGWQALFDALNEAKTPAKVSYPLHDFSRCPIDKRSLGD